MGSSFGTRYGSFTNVTSACVMERPPCWVLGSMSGYKGIRQKSVGLDGCSKSFWSNGLAWLLGPDTGTSRRYFDFNRLEMSAHIIILLILVEQCSSATVKYQGLLCSKNLHKCGCQSADSYNSLQTPGCLASSTRCRSWTHSLIKLIASVSRPRPFHVKARLAMLLGVSGCSDPSSSSEVPNVLVVRWMVCTILTCKFVHS